MPKRSIGSVGSTMRVGSSRKMQKNPCTGIKNPRSEGRRLRSTFSASCTRIAKNWRTNAACGAQLRTVSRKRSLRLVSPISRISGLESQISRRHLSGSKEPRNTTTLTLKLHWDDVMKLAKASSKIIISPVNGIEKPQYTSQTWEERDREETNWDCFIWMVLDFQRTTSRTTCGFPWRAPKISRPSKLR